MIFDDMGCFGFFNYLSNYKYRVDCGISPKKAENNQHNMFNNESK